MGDLAVHCIRCGQPCADRDWNILPGTGMGLRSTMGPRGCGRRVMGRRLPQIFFFLSLASLVLLMAAIWQANTPSWKTYQRQFFQLEAQGEPNAAAKAAVLNTPPQV